MLASHEAAHARAVALEVQTREAYPFLRYFPDTGPLRRELYPRSLEFFAAGRLHRERLFLAANRTSKTVSAGYETACHLTGRYPAWWPGRKFEGPSEAWAAGDTRETTRDVIQLELLGNREGIRADKFSGMIPAHLILDRTLKSGVADCIDTVWVRHSERHHGAPCTSVLGFKAYDQGRLSFQGTSKRLIWLDEEPPDASSDATQGGTPSGNGDIYTECLLRTATTGGMIMATFTPLRGLTPFLDEYLQSAEMCSEEGFVGNAKSLMFGEEG